MADLVAIDLPGGPRFVEALVGAWEAGHAVAPLDRRLAPGARRALLAALRPRMLELARTSTDGAHPYFVPPSHTPLAREVLGDLLADEPSESDTRAMPAEPIAPETTTSSASPSPPTPPLL